MTIHICPRCAIDCRTATGLAYHEQARMRLGACLDLPPLPSDECEMVLCRACRAPFKIDPAFAAHERVRMENGGICGTPVQVQARMEAGWNGGRVGSGGRLESGGRPAGGGRLEGGNRLESGNRFESGGRPESGNRLESGSRPDSNIRAEALAVPKKEPDMADIPQTIPAFAARDQARVQSDGNYKLAAAQAKPEADNKPDSDIPTQGPVAPKKEEKQPDITEVPPGEEGMWRIVPETGKRFLSSISGKPVLDEKSRDYVLNFAKKYEPSRVGPDGKLL
ncbi:uncharacterized protein SEPMUDRAFT_118331 [Sphaerulina musiva SO2202]|uniref:Uncharacterized protein n=1 Tax=Sphaerulina musiva (strain SO2202) TaxID=692275 RepID=M3D1L3_SPHMS|nr:uncharacterized protein SEPMUDRAFT_118331 [Sphaerulina musiva SO2202]EMF11022.1 hypothetical protein SEPMUDRAFT_118331 [Sphaerulina musiva SO2202]